MILTGFLVTFLFSSCWAEGGISSDQDIPFLVASQGNSNEEIPFMVASQGNSDRPKVSNLLPELPDVPPLTGAQSNRGRSDIDIENDQISGGYSYPKPSKPFDLPPFTTLDASAPPEVVSSFAEHAELERLPRSPRRRPHFQSPPPFIPGFIPPHNIRPLPALYGGRY